MLLKYYSSVAVESTKNLNTRLLQIVIVLFFINAGGNLAYYMTVNLFSLSNSIILKDIRVIIFLFSLIFVNYIILFYKNIQYIKVLNPFYLIIIFGFLSNIWSPDKTVITFVKTLTFLLPLLYILQTIRILHSNFNLFNLKKILWLGFYIVYVSPLIIYLIFEKRFESTYLSLYVQYFKHNQYGWASILYLLLTFDIYKNYKNNRFFILINAILVPVAFFVLFTCGNRSTWLSSGISIIIFLFLIKNNYSLLKKGFISLFLIICFFALNLNPESSLNIAKERTLIQLSNGMEASLRFKFASIGFYNFNQTPYKCLFGNGLFNYLGLDGIGSHGYHNSYYEILFGFGILIFVIFVRSMVILPLKNYLKYYAKNSILLAPLIIIPFFESNITGGQFIFYPWFSIMIFYSLPVNSINNETNHPIL
jgi:hypothetical protein